MGLVFVLLSGYEALRTLNREAAEAICARTPQPTPLIAAVVLPGGHTPPTSPGGAPPNEAEIPGHLRPRAQALASVPVPTPGPERPKSIFISAI